MFACLELLKVSESVARRTGDLSAQVGRRVVCVAPCRLSKPVQAKSARLVPKDCPSVKREKKNCFDAWAIICASRADFVFFFDTWVWIEFRTADMQIVFKF